jgi:hypothetical protein
VALFARPFHAAELNKREPARLSRRDARGQVRLNGLVHMKLQLFVQFALPLALQQRLAQKKQQPS